MALEGPPSNSPLAKTALAFCRDCFSHCPWPDPEVKNSLPKRCPSCSSPRLLAHSELRQLSIAHLDCDAFYAAVEKRDDPSLEGKPVIIGGGKRGVVATACYTARLFGVHSAMPMFKALKACPKAVVIRPDMAKYSAVGRQVRALMQETTPLVEPLSIDEAFLDLSGTSRLHKQSPAETAAKLVSRIEEEIGITISVGLSHNKFLAKLASDLDKPRGFSIIGKAETLSLLAELPISKIWGVGKVFEKKLHRDGFRTIKHLQDADESKLIKAYGEMGLRLARLSKGEDSRIVKTSSKAKSISAETTFSEDYKTLDDLTHRLWPLCEKVSARAKKSGKVGKTITLKLKTANFKIRTRAQSLPQPTQLAEALYKEGRKLLEREVDGTPYRLLGIGISGLSDADLEAAASDLFENEDTTDQATENAIDSVREKFGKDAIVKGRALKKKR